MESSQRISDVVYADKRTKYYRPMKIREWSDYFREFGEFPDHKLGCHPKVTSMILDEGVRSKLLRYIRSLNRTQILSLNELAFARHRRPYRDRSKTKTRISACFSR